MEIQKKEYCRPKINELGSFIQVTQGTGSKPGDGGNLTVKTGNGN